MKKICLTLVMAFLGMYTASYSQCCPYIATIEVLPMNPNATDLIQIATLVATPNNGSLVQHDFYWQNDTLVLEACYYSGFLTVVTPIYDTIDVGVVPAGDYVLQFNAHISLSENSCVSVETNDTTSYFSVVDVLDLPVNAKDESPMLYPNPSSDYLKFSTTSDESTVRLYSLSGKELEVPFLFSDGKLILDIRELSNGNYWIQEQTNQGIVHNYIFMKND